MNFNEIEKKWQNYWDDHKTFEVSNNSDKKSHYILVEFPYPSGSGLHVGHVRSYTAQDALARMMRMQGYNVLYPMGWDAFGAPAEQYAIQNHIHPKEAVKENIKTFKGQMKSLGFSFDWSREFSTTDPEYYKWTQWQFLQFYKHGMAYKDTIPVNWCPACKSVLSNEDDLNSYKPVDVNEVQLMTIHKSKGLEFDVVFHLNVNEWELPSKRIEGNDFDHPVYLNKEQDLDLHYVGITRAKKACILLRGSQRRNTNGELKSAADSEFLTLNDVNLLRQEFDYVEGKMNTHKV